MSGSPRRERKVVTVLFADLVGFTARAESLDPEDVEAILRPYHERLRRELEKRGGTVEKFIGDAVMAVFGAPVAHEDDAERAVRAALAIRDAIVEDGQLEVRVAVNTGEALVNLDARPDAGEGMVAGDVVNTAARLQSAAPTNGILVGEPTYRATEHLIVYRDRADVEAKGKSEPLRVREAVEARARVGVELREPSTPLVGRERERELLLSTFEHARREGATQLVTIVGVPGIGKSRLVAELFGALEREAELTHWRQGRSLPYGEGGTFWAFGEMVKAQAGILEGDAAADAERKLHDAVATVVADDDAGWIEARLRPLVGLSGEGGARDETFAAWRRFVEAVADQRPTVLIFEDLHWADDELLDFVDELADWAENVPLLVVATARPELFDRRPGWGGGKRNALTISLAPLDDDQTARLLAALLQRSVLPAEQQQALLARAGGNPLYAEQFARMFAERGDAGAALPENVQGIIAARLDSLPPAEKGLVLDAAVLGKTFWRSALDGEEAETHLHSLQRKEFIRRERRSSVAGESEFSFAHVLIRDVAYSQIPRADRATKHVQAARWIESLTGDRADDLAELRAHHYLAALDLAEAAGSGITELADDAIEALVAAAQRSAKLFAFAQTERYASRVLQLAGADDPRRAEAALELSAAEGQLGKVGFVEHASEAAAAFAARGENESAATAETIAADWLWNFGRRDEAHAAAERALELVRDAPPSQAKLGAFAARARLLMLSGEIDEAIRLTREGIEAAQQLGDDDARSSMLITLGTARTFIDGGGIAEIEQGIAIADRLNLPREFTRGHNNLAEEFILAGDLAEPLRRYEIALERVERLGIVQSIAWLLPQRASVEYLLGDWAAVEKTLEHYERLAETMAGHYLDFQRHWVRALMATARDVREAESSWERSLASARELKDPQALAPVLAGSGVFCIENGRREEAGAFLDELLGLPSYYTAQISMGWLLHDLGRAPKIPEIRGGVWGAAGESIARGELVAAAELLGETDLHTEEAYARLRAAEALAAEGRDAEAAVHRDQALAFYRSVGAARYLQRAEAMLPASA
jgi:class 3 adenylate cyclase/tetratricopeptide (TPR) repeat protein